MLLTNRRLGLIYFCLAGMEMAWFTPFFLLFYRPLDEKVPQVVFLGLFGAFLAYILMLEFLNLMGLDWPFFELAVVGLIVLSSLLFVRLWYYKGAPLGNLIWLGNTLGALFNFQQGIRRELVLLLSSAFLWQRAANATSRDVNFFGVGFSFRLGLLLMIVGASILNSARGQDVRPILWLFIGLGLTAVALARTRDRAISARSQGSLLPLRRLGQLLLAVGITVGGAAWLSRFYTPDGIKRALLWLKPLWTLLSPVLEFLVRALLWVLQPVLIWLVWLLSRFLSGLDLSFAQELLESVDGNLSEQPTYLPSEVVPRELPPWVWVGLRYFFVLLASALVLGLVLLYLEKMGVKPKRRDEAEEERAEEVTLGGATLGRRVRWLRNVAGLVRRFGLGRQLLAAISVQNIYANLCRLARRRGYPRRPAQPPDDYLPVLAQAFAGQEEALARITAAYMRVHYGDQPVSVTELAQLRQSYHQVRKSE